MLGYATLGTNDFAQAVSFYSEVFDLLGVPPVMNDGRMAMWGNPGEDGVFAVCTPYDGAPATAGNGSMFGLRAQSKSVVDQVYAKGLTLGGTDEGPPGMRQAFYSAYFRDLDGNKLVVYAVET